MHVTHARPLHPAALAFVPFGIVLVRVRVRKAWVDLKPAKFIECDRGPWKCCCTMPREVALGCRVASRVVVRSSERRRGGTRKFKAEFRVSESERPGSTLGRRNSSNVTEGRENAAVRCPGRLPSGAAAPRAPALGHILTHIDSLGDTLFMGSRETLLLPRGSRAINYSAASNPFALIPVIQARYSQGEVVHGGAHEQHRI